ncbi:MAG: zinc-binding alcohol dehydrogenase family protein [Eudoraea sp.]|uniref:zinc-binding alcohol dehydrogenase family protein n=1 Tax=Eudoraea sp. TaxID=1979955 RepID=UPI003C71B181
MKYVVCEEPGRFSIKDKKFPKRGEGEVLLKIKRVGICGTDLHAYKGNQPFFTYPRILGHEIAAEVYEVDSTRKEFTKGDKVAIMPYINCGTCRACAKGKTNCCEKLHVFGIHTDGGMQEYVSLRTDLLLKANELTEEEISIIEPLAIGAHALKRGDIKSDDFVVVMGCGPIGLGIIKQAKMTGAIVIAIDLNLERLEFAKEIMKADHIILMNEEVIPKLKQLTNNAMGDLVFDATGNKMALEFGVKLLGHGGRYVLVGLSKGNLEFYHPEIHAKETTLLCSRNATMVDFQEVMERISDFPTNAYISTSVPFDLMPNHFEAWTANTSNIIKATITF